jgi:hypothetical protein
MTHENVTDADRVAIKRRTFLAAAAAASLLPQGAFATAADDFPPGWLPVNKLTNDTPWAKTDDRIRLYLPRGDEPVRGVFACFVFHSQDPRELADLWNFALVTVPWPFEYDLGINDKRNGRYEVGHPMQDMGLLLRYLDAAARETGHKELSTAPIVGWLGQNGSHFCRDLYERAPERVLAWSDSFPDRLRRYPELTKHVPFAFAWEISKNELRQRARVMGDNDKPLADLSCRANTYGFGHGIYSKYSFFAAFLDRCIALRMPAQLPAPGMPVKLKPVQRTAGWSGDYEPISEWNPIAPADSAEAQAMKYPCWLPDEYAAWMWRSYHSAAPDIKLTGPIVEYAKFNDKWGGPQCGLGYGGYLKKGEPLTFSAKADGDYAQVIFHSGHRPLGEVTSTPWTLEGVKLEPGLHALSAVGIRRDGARASSRAAFAVVK